MMSELKRVLSQHHAQQMRGKLGGSAMCICGQGCGSTEACGEYGILLRDLATATAKIEALEANLSAAASLADLARDVSDVFEPANKREALASDKLREALEAFEALEQENTDA